MQSLLPPDNNYDGHVAHHGNEKHGAEWYGYPDVQSLQSWDASNQEGEDDRVGAVDRKHTSTVGSLVLEQMLNPVSISFVHWICIPLNPSSWSHEFPLLFCVIKDFMTFPIAQVELNKN